ncbi:hypothetical protein PFISCL1PPCAC_11963, partial [Pristionchus fissidentatus]
RHGTPAVMRAVRRGDLEEMERLVGEGCDLNETNDGGWTALSEAVSLHRPDLVDFLLQRGADANCASSVGWA